MDAVSADTCILDLNLPDGATVAVSGRDYGTRRRLRFSGLRGGKTYVAHLVVRFSDGTEQQHQIFVEAGRTIRLCLPNPAQKRPEIVLQRGHTGALICAALSPDERYLVTGGGDHAAILWDAATGRRLRDFGGHGRCVTGVAFTSDSRRVLTTSLEGTVSLWDAATGKRIRSFYSDSQYCPRAALTSDDRRLAVSSRRGVVLLDVESGARLRVLQNDESDVRALAFSPDGSHLLTGHLDGACVLWDTATGRKVWTSHEHKWAVDFVLFSPDGRQTLGMSLNPHVAIVWDVRTGMKRRMLFGGTGPYSRAQPAAFSPDGRRLLMLWGAGAVVWDLSTGRMLNKFGTYVISYSPRVRSIMFTFAGRPLALASRRESSRMNLCDVETGQTVCVFEAGSRRVVTIAASADGRHLADARQWMEFTAVLWEAASGRQIRTLGKPWYDPRAAKTQSLLVRSGGDAEGHANLISSVAFSPDGQHVLTAGGPDGTAVLWEANSGRQVRRFRRHRQSGGLGGFLTNGFRVVRLGQLVGTRNLKQLREPDETLGLGAAWRDLESSLKGLNVEQPLNVEEAQRLSGLLEEAYLKYHEALETEYWRVAEAAAVLAGEQDLRDVDEAYNAFYKQFHGLFAGSSPELKGWVDFLAFSPDGQRVVAGSRVDDAAIIWDTRTGQRLKTLERHTGGVYCVAFSPDGESVVTGSGEGNVTLWDANAANKLKTFQSPVTWSRYTDSKSVFQRQSSVEDDDRDGLLALEESRRQTGAPSSVAWTGFGPDGRQILASFRDATAVLWDAKTGKTLRVLRADQSQERPVVAYHPAAFRPDGRYVATGESDGTVILWDAESGHLLQRLVGHEGEVTCLAFFPDCQRLASGSSDGTIRIWDLSTGEQLAMLISFDGGRDWLVLTREGFFDGSAGAREKVCFRIGDGLTVAPVDRFFQDFYYPGLLAAIWRGERPLPKVEMGQSLPPKVRIVGPERGGDSETDRVTLQVEVADEGGGIRGPWLVQNGVRVPASGEAGREGELVRRTFETRLVEGENRLEVRAASADGSWESEPAVIAFRYEKPLPKPELYLVAVGVNRYADQVMNLQFARSDALAMAKLFRARGQALYGQIHLTLLVDEQATGAGIVQAIREVAAKARPQDVVVVFLAGHGAVVGQQYYFLPQGFQHKAATLDEDVAAQGLPAAEVNDVLGTVPALKRMLIFDTGQSGGQVGLARTGRDPFAFRGAIERLGRAQGNFAIACAAVSDQAQEVGPLKHGVLSYALLAGLHAVDGGPLQKQWIEPASGDRVAEVLEWFGFASSHVPQLTKQYFGQEQDIQHASAGASFPVLPVPASAEVPEATLAADSTAHPEPQPVVPVVGAGQSSLYMVSVGINRYAEEAMNLKYARSDAVAMADLFRKRGAAVYREVHAQELPDEQATKAGITKAIGELAAQAKREDTLVVFLAGHATMVGQRYYFIPQDFRRNEATLEEDIRQQGLPADALGDAVSSVPALKRVLILDTCASGGALHLSRQGQDPFAFRGAIENLAARQGVFTIAASGAGEEAQEIDALGHGVLTYTLLAALRVAPPGGPLEGLAIQPNSPDGRVDILEWLSFASGHVPRLTKRYLGREQAVQIGGQGSSFPVLPLSE